MQNQLQRQQYYQNTNYKNFENRENNNYKKIKLKPNGGL